MSALTQWIMVTNIVALFSGLMFYKFEKGETISIIGSILFVVNFLQVIPLFFYSQVKIFDQDMRDCKNEAKNDTNFIWQFYVCLAYIIIQYLKIMMIIIATIFAKFCIKGK